MVIPENWNDIEKNINCDNTLPLGGHICKILDIKEYTSKDGNKSLKIWFDINDDNEFKNCYQKMYEAGDFLNERWPNEGIKYISLKEKNLPYLKEFIEAVRKSNQIELDIQVGKHLNLEQFSGLLVAGQFGLEEYKNKNDEIKMIVSLFRFRSIDELSDIKVPKVKLLNGTQLDYEEYQKR